MMRNTRFLLFAVITLALATAQAFGSATNIYITQSGSATGNCTTNVQTPAFFNTASNWGSGSSQIGPGTTVLLCGTFASSVQGGNVLTVRGSGAAGSPVTILFDTDAQMNSTGWWGTYNADACSTCNGAITVNGYNYITIDGGTNGVIQNTLSGASGNTCSAGTCTQQPGSAGSLGIHLGGNYLVVKNLTIKGIYMNAGSSSSATDTGGQATADIRVDGSPTNLMIFNNKFYSARAGIWGGFNGSTGPNSCPTPGSAAASSGTGSGICIYNNDVSDHAWQMTLNSNGTNSVVNVFNNNIGDSGSMTGWINWQFPTDLYHQDGIFIWGSSANQIVTANIYNNYIHGDLGSGSPSALIYCANNGVNGSGTGCALTAFNNVVALTGAGLTGDQIIAMKLDVTGVNMGPVKLYNNTFIGGAYSLELYNISGGPSFALTMQNNIFYPGSSSITRWYIHQENSGSPISSITANNNLYYNGSGQAWNLNGQQYGTLSNWENGCSCDLNSVSSSPLLGSDFVPASTSPVLTLGSNLTSLSLTSLDYDKNLIARPGASGGAWTAGAYGLSNLPPSPTSLTTTLQ
jgi:hypothetical protein